MTGFDIQPQELLDAMPGRVILLDREGRILAFNDEADRVTRQAMGQPLGLGNSIFRDLAPEDRQFFVDSLEACWQGMPRESRRTLTLNNGTTYHRTFHFRPCRGSDGQISRCLLFVYDASEHQAAERLAHKHETFFRELFEHSNQAAFILNPREEGRMLDCNQTALEMFEGEDKAQLLAMNWAELLGLTDATESLTIRAKAAHNTTHTLERTFRTLRGNTFTGLLAIRYFTLEEELVGMIKITDLTSVVEAHHQLKISEILFRNLFEQSQDALFVIYPDQGCSIAKCNSRAVELFEAGDQSRLIGMTGLPTQELALLDGVRILEQLRDRGYFQEEIEYETFKGHTFPGLLTITQFQTDERPVQLARVTDLTQVKEAQQMLLERDTRLKLAFQAGNLIYWDDDLRENTVLWRGNIRPLFGVEGEAHVTLREEVINYIHPEDRDRSIQNAQAALLHNIPYVVEKRLITWDGSVMWVLSRAEVFHNAEGKPERMVGIMVDITEQKNIQAELERTREQARAANRAKSDFLGNMSHEFRNLLAIITGYAYILEHSKLTEHQASYVGRIRESSEILTTILSDILDVIRLESDRITLKNRMFDFRQKLGTVLSAYEATANEKYLYYEWNIHPDIPQFLVGDLSRLVQILTNLIGNAIKFTDKGYVLVNINPLNPVTDPELRLEFSIRDSGIGMSAETQAHLFEPFYQANISTTKKHEGTGLGLSIVQRLVDLMAGSIHIDSVPDEGTLVTVRLTFLRQQTECPTDAPESEPDHQAVTVRPKIYQQMHQQKWVIPEDQDPSRPHLLLVEDKQVNAEMLGLVLEEACYRITVAYKGSEALEWVRSQPFDLILMDVGLPDIDGLEVARQIRREEQSGGRTVPIIGLSGYASEQDVQRAYDAGMNDYLTKPVDHDLLKARIRYFLEAVAGTPQET